MNTKKSRKKVLFVEGNPDRTIGGSYFSLFFLVDGIDKNQYEPTVIFHTNNRLIPMYQAAGLNTLVFDLPIPMKLTTKTRFSWIVNKPLLLLQKFVNFSRGFLLRDLRYALYMRKNGIDLLHLNNSIVRNHSWMLAAYIARIKCVTHERGINASFSSTSRFFAKRLNSIICISEAVKSNMVRKGIGPDNLVVIHNGLDPKRVKVDTPAEEIKRQYNIQMDSKIIGIIGNIREWKGQEVVIRATHILKQKHPKVVCFIVGATADEHKYYENRLLDLTNSLDLKPNVVFTGYRADVSSFLNALDIVVHASILPEPFGRVLIEAMALRKPLVGANGGAVPEIIEDGVTGVCCEPGSVEQFANAIDMLLSDPAKAYEMGQKGYERLEQEFHIDKNIQKTQDLYKKILG